MTLIIVIVLGVVALVGIIVWLAVRAVRRERAREQARSAAIANLAPQLGLTLTGGNGILRADAQGFNSHLFTRGSKQAAFNALEGTSSGLRVVLFDYRFEESSGEETTTIHESVAAFASPKGPLPAFVLKKRGIFSRLTWKKVEIEGNPEFSKRFILNGSDGATIKRLFSPSAAGFLASTKMEEKLVMEAAGPWLFLHGGRCSPENLAKFLEETSQVASGFFQNCGAMESVKAS